MEDVFLDDDDGTHTNETKLADLSDRYKHEFWFEGWRRAGEMVLSERY